MKTESEVGITIPVSKVQKRVAEATRASGRTLCRISKECENVETGVAMAFSTPRKLRPKVCTKSILDNARKGEMLFWLNTHGIRYSSDMTKAELYDLIKMHKPQYETFAIDCLLADHGHSDQTASQSS
jgi:hypothetical protein